jgi:HSP20 family molecular chaperone IbpA
MLPSRIFFDDFFDDMDKPRRFENNLMKCDIFEKDGKFNIEMDVPGFKKDDIKMDLDDGYLTVTAEKKEESKDEDGKNYIRRERTSYARCERKFYVGNIDDSLVKAEFKNGTLLITVPKEEEPADTKKYITID